MDSERASALRDGEKNHFSPRSNGGSERTLLKLPFIIGVAGGTASGKTTVCNMIISQLHDQRVVLVNQVNPSDVIILEGILVLHDSRVRDLMNMKIFVDTGSLL
ncbi:hypothetical protein DH2020_020859 [Rehmannia glutinosa]|uniref:Phosphoribulokinase/uridine kinase domain-containing protein n=1 Tax=Rehmannia glutinosa TaxID=99300 RepID=A0ABR0WAF5_REHGL